MSNIIIMIPYRVKYQYGKWNIKYSGNKIVVVN